jgi:hypothetical protein
MDEDAAVGMLPLVSSPFSAVASDLGASKRLLAPASCHRRLGHSGLWHQERARAYAASHSKGPHATRWTSRLQFFTLTSASGRAVLEGEEVDVSGGHRGRGGLLSSDNCFGARRTAMRLHIDETDCGLLSFPLRQLQRPLCYHCSPLGCFLSHFSLRLSCRPFSLIADGFPDAVAELCGVYRLLHD